MMEVQASFWLGMTANEIEARSWERIDFDYEEPEAKGVTAKFIARNVIWNHLMQGAVNRFCQNSALAARLSRSKYRLDHNI